MGDHVAIKARLAGFLYVLLVAAGFFAEYFVRGQLMTASAVETAQRIRAGEELFRLGFGAEVVGGGFYVAVVTLLYEVLRPAGRSLSLHAAVFGLIGCAVFIVNLINKLAVIVLIANGQSDDLIFVFLKLHVRGYQLAMVFFGCYLLFAGWVMLRARFLPRFLGTLWFVGGFGYVAFYLLNFVAEDAVGDLRRYFTTVGNIGEIVLALWLLVFGVNAEKWRAQANAEGS
ncbi:DUF4386 domain-containing protein [Terricaulis sp.]|uniref:DUF4386 domain-containing protein n=1 Tax=Terricaulis sp. TaxID=2768686 RepID=UPI0037851D73